MIEQTLTNAFNDCLKMAKRYWPEIGEHSIMVSVRNIGFDYAGRANQKTGMVYLNPHYGRMNLDYMVSEIVPHELAHIVQDLIAPNARYLHGKEWKDITRKLGGDPKMHIRIPLNWLTI